MKRADLGLTEREIQDGLMQIVRRHEDRWPDMRWIHHSPNEVVSPARARVMKQAGCRAGILDVEWAFRVVCSGEDAFDLQTFAGLAIELKTARGLLRPEQRDRMEWLIEQGWRVVVCRSPWEAWREILLYSGLNGKCRCADCRIALEWPESAAKSRKVQNHRDKA